MILHKVMMYFLLSGLIWNGCGGIDRTWLQEAASRIIIYPQEEYKIQLDLMLTEISEVDVSLAFGFVY